MGSDGVWRVVGVLVAFAVGEAFGAGVVAVLEMSWDGDQSALTDFLPRFADREARRVRLGGTGQVGDRLGKCELTLGQADELAGLHRGDGERQRVGVGVADVFAREDHEATSEKANIFAAFEHAS